MTAQAQYTEEIRFISLEYFLTNKILFKDAYKRNSEILKERFVKKIIIQDENNKTIADASVDKNGRVISSREYSPIVRVSPVHTNAGYDLKNNLVQLTRNDIMNDDTLIINFGYVGNTLLNYRSITAGEVTEYCDIRYDDKSDMSKLTGFDSPLWQGDSVPYSVNFKYDSQNRLIDVRVVQDKDAVYEISYSGDTVKIVSGDGEGYESYVMRDNVIISHIIFSEQLNFTAIRNFTYDENGLISRISIEDGRGNKYFQKYEYNYSH